MKRISLLSFLLSLAITVSGQSLDSLGLDNSPILNIYESECLNKEFENERGEFDLTGKRVAFYNPVYGRGKMAYFKSFKEYALKGSYVVAELVILTPEENGRYGLDAVISYWNKRSIANPPQYREKILSWVSKNE